MLIINASYKKEGFSDQIHHSIERYLDTQGSSYRSIFLREEELHYCDNCRRCMQEEGESPGSCTYRDGMDAIIKALEEESRYVFIVPTNMGTVTALFKCFLERLSVYGYWPWGEAAPLYRKNKLIKKAVCLSSCAAPSFLATFVWDTMKPMRLAAKCVGARVVKECYIGNAANKKGQTLSEAQQQKAVKAVMKL